MKTSNEVEPALMKGKGNPVGGIEPLNTSYCSMNFYFIFSSSTGSHSISLLS